jgi:hypothetical protein
MQAEQALRFTPAYYWFPPAPAKAIRIAAFLRPLEFGEERRSRWSGVIETERASEAEVQEECLRLWGLPVPGIGNLYGSLEEGYAAIVGGRTILFGPDESVLAALRRAYLEQRDTPFGPELRDAITRFAGEPVYGGFVLPAGIAGRVPEGLAAEEINRMGGDVPKIYLWFLFLYTGRFGDLPPWLKGGEGSSGSFGLGSRLRAQASFIHASAEDARQAYEEATKAIGQRRERLLAEAADWASYNPTPQVLAAMFDAIRVTAHGSEVEFAVEFGLQEWEAFDFAFLRTTMGPHHETRQQTNDLYLIHRVGLAIQAYADENGGEFPPSLEFLYQSGYVEGDEFFISPVDGRLAARDRWQLLHRYEYLGSLGPGLLRPTIICYTRKGIYPDGRNILRADGAVGWVYETGFHNPEGTGWFDESYRYLMRARGEKLTEEQKARAREFYEIEE